MSASKKLVKLEDEHLEEACDGRDDKLLDDLVPFRRQDLSHPTHIIADDDHDDVKHQKPESEGSTVRPEECDEHVVIKRNVLDAKDQREEVCEKVDDEGEDPRIDAPEEHAVAHPEVPTRQRMLLQAVAGSPAEGDPLARPLDLHRVPWHKP